MHAQNQTTIFLKMYIKVKTLNKTLHNCVYGNKSFSEQLATLLRQLVGQPHSVLRGGSVVGLCSGIGVLTLLIS